jgi:hypothetical protein
VDYLPDLHRSQICTIGRRSAEQEVHTDMLGAEPRIYGHAQFWCVVDRLSISLRRPKDSALGAETCSAPFTQISTLSSCSTAQRVVDAAKVMSLLICKVSHACRHVVIWS